MKKTNVSQPNRRRAFLPKGLSLAALAAAAGLVSVSLRAELPTHDVAAASLNIVQNSTANTAAAITATTPVTVNGLVMRTGANRADYNIAIGPDATDDVSGGVLISAIAENGRDNGEVTFPGINYLTSAVDYDRATGTYYIPVFNAPTTGGGGSGAEYNVNVGAAWFPYGTWRGGFARNGATPVLNGGPNDLVSASAGVSFTDNTNGIFTVSLLAAGLDSRVHGVLLACGGKNEGNFSTVQVNTNNGTWTLNVRDNTTAGVEQDPIAFVFIPKTNTTVVSGRFLGNGDIEMFSGTAPAFTVANIATGRYLLKVPGRSPTNGVLVISAEGGRTVNADNIVSYQPTPEGDGWIIESRDKPANTLESPGATEPVVSFVYVPAATPGYTVIPTNNVLTTENGGTATFTVALHTQPTDTVTIAVSSGNILEGTVSPELLTFTPTDWNIPQTITVTGQDDAAIDGSVAYTIVLDPAVSTDLQYNGLKPANVAAVNADNEAGITVAPTSGLTTTEGGGTATFSLHLNTQPSGDVTIPIFSANLTEGTVAVDHLTFTTADWNVDQPVVVTGANDFAVDGNVAYTIITGAATSADGNYQGLNASDVTVVNNDDDVAGVTVSASGPNGLTVIEGRTATYTVVLTSQPTTNVAVNVFSTDTVQGATVFPTSLTFTTNNWNTPQTVTIFGGNDLVMDGNTSYTLTNQPASADANYTVLAGVPVLMTTLDDEAALTLPSGETPYGVGQGPVGIDGRATLTDPYTTNFNTTLLVVALTNNVTAEDRLGIRHTGADAGQIGVVGNVVSYGGIGIATFTGGSGSTPLTVTFNANASGAAEEALLRSVTFSNVNSTNPSLATRTASVVLTHPDGGVSAGNLAVRMGWLRMADFQEGTDHGYGVYTGQYDIYLSESLPDAAFPSGNANAQIFVDYPEIGAHNAFHGLLQFTNIFGDALGQVPSNAVIVSAELILNVGDAGDGSPLYRMLVPWDPNFATWNGMDVSISADQNEVRGVADSLWGLIDGSGDTGFGAASIAVTPDLLAWQAGEANYGWFLPGWPTRTDGTGYYTSETTNSSLRPRLRVAWLPTTGGQASFRQNVNDYTNAADTRIRENAPDVSGATAGTLFCDWAVTLTSDNEQVLLRFDNLFGAGSNQIPAGAQINAAVLDVASTGNNAMGAGGKFHVLLRPWVDTNNWNFWTGGIQADGVDAAVTPTATAGFAALTPRAQGGYHTYDLTPDVQAWSDGTIANNGWVILPWVNGTDGWGIATAESGVEADRPRLRVYYTAVPNFRATLLTPELLVTGLRIHFRGMPAQNYTILRAAKVDGPYVPIGTTEVQPNGTGMYTDGVPLSGAAFYRISYP